jgi:hypothetical protein
MQRDEKINVSTPLTIVRLLVAARVDRFGYFARHINSSAA